MTAREIVIAQQWGGLRPRGLRPARPRLLDLFCGAGGAAMGYHRAGFEVVGVDIKTQPHYQFEFHQADAMTYSADGFDAVHASPPCQRYTVLGSVVDLSGYPDLVAEVRERLEESGLPWVIENVPGAPLRSPVRLCGAMFPGLRVYRHRLFETSFCVEPLDHPKHAIRVNRRGENRREHWKAGGFITVTGDIGSYAGVAMDIEWMTGNELSQAIPPAYTEYIGDQLLAATRLPAATP